MIARKHGRMNGRSRASSGYWTSCQRHRTILASWAGEKRRPFFNECQTIRSSFETAKTLDRCSLSPIAPAEQSAPLGSSLEMGNFPWTFQTSGYLSLCRSSTWSATAWNGQSSVQSAWSTSTNDLTMCSCENHSACAQHRRCRMLVDSRSGKATIASRWKRCTFLQAFVGFSSPTRSGDRSTSRSSASRVTATSRTLRGEGLAAMGECWSFFFSSLVPGFFFFFFLHTLDMSSTGSVSQSAVRSQCELQVPMLRGFGESGSCVESHPSFLFAPQLAPAASISRLLPVRAAPHPFRANCFFFFFSFEAPEGCFALTFKNTPCTRFFFLPIFSRNTNTARSNMLPTIW